MASSRHNGKPQPGHLWLNGKNALGHFRPISVMFTGNWQALWAYYVRVFGEIYRCVNFNINFLNIANETFRMFCLLSTGLREAGFERWPRVDPRRADQVIFHEFLVSWRGCCVCRWGGHLSSEMTPASGTVNWIFLPIKCGWWQCGRLPAFLWAPGG